MLYRNLESDDIGSSTRRNFLKSSTLGLGSQLTHVQQMVRVRHPDKLVARRFFGTFVGFFGRSSYMLKLLFVHVLRSGVVD